MKVEVLYFEGCPYYVQAAASVRQVVSELGLGVSVEEVQVKNDDDAIRRRFIGSPTVRVNGLDIEPAARSRTDYAMSCRRYGPSGLPPKAQVLAALREARRDA